MAQRLFERADDVSDRVIVPMHLYGAGTFTSTSGQSISINIGGRSHANLNDRRLLKMIEDEIVDTFLRLPSAQVLLSEQFEMGRDRIWCLVRAERRVLLPSSPAGDIGEFDIIVGRIVDDYVDLSTLGLVECKVAKTQALTNERRAKLPKYSSGWGTRQLEAARELGFDFLLAGHFLVRPPSDGPDQSWSAAADASNFRREAERLYGLMEKQVPEPAHGLLAIGWGHVSGADPRLSGVLMPMELWKSPRQARTANVLRTELQQSLRRLIPSRRPAARFFRFCEKCGTADLFSSDDAFVLRCAKHR